MPPTPPSFEIWEAGVADAAVADVEGSNGRAYTSKRPDAFELKARYFPSGDRRPPRPMNSGFFSSIGLRSPSTGSRIMVSLAAHKQRKRPSADQSVMKIPGAPAGCV